MSSINSIIYILLISTLSYSKPNSLQNVISRVTVFMTNDTKILTNDLKKDDKTIFDKTIHLTTEGDMLDVLEKNLPVYGRHLKKLETKYNLKFNLLSNESQNFVIEIEKILPEEIFEDKKKLDNFIKNIFIPKYLKLTGESKNELKNFYNKSEGIQMAIGISKL